MSDIKFSSEFWISHGKKGHYLSFRANMGFTCWSEFTECIFTFPVLFRFFLPPPPSLPASLLYFIPVQHLIFDFTSILNVCSLSTFLDAEKCKKAYQLHFLGGNLYQTCIFSRKWAGLFSSPLFKTYIKLAEEFTWLLMFSMVSTQKSKALVN